MARIVVLGGAGGIGSAAVRALTAVDDFAEIVAAEELAAELGDARVTAAAFDVTDATSIAAAVRGADVVVNCVGPFYRFGPSVLAATVAAGVSFVEVLTISTPRLPCSISTVLPGRRASPRCSAWATRLGWPTSS